MFDTHNLTAILTIDATPGYSYQVQGRTSLTSGEWEDLGAPQSAQDTTIQIEVNLQPAYEHSAFFRVIAQP